MRKFYTTRNSELAEFTHSGSFTGSKFEPPMVRNSNQPIRMKETLKETRIFRGATPDLAKRIFWILLILFLIGSALLTTGCQSPFRDRKEWRWEGRVPIAPTYEIMSDGRIAPTRNFQSGRLPRR